MSEDVSADAPARIENSLEGDQGHPSPLGWFLSKYALTRSVFELEFFFLLQMNENFVRTQLVPLSVGLCQTQEHNLTSDIKDISSKTCKTSDLKLSFCSSSPRYRVKCGG